MKRRGAVARACLSPRGRALLSFGVVVPLGFTGTLAAWTDSANITGTSLTSGSIDVQLNNGDNYAQTTLSMTNMVPGNTSAEAVTLKNNGLSPYKWSITGGLSGTNASDFNSAIPNGMKLTITNGAKSGSGTSATCGAGTTTYVNAVSLTSTTTTSLASGQGPLAAAGTQSLCVQLTFDTNAASSLQNKSISVTLTFTGTSDLA